jgi:hypothetical protein
MFTIFESITLFGLSEVLAQAFIGFPSQAVNH